MNRSKTTIVLLFSGLITVLAFQNCSPTVQFKASDQQSYSVSNKYPESGAPDQPSTNSNVSSTPSPVKFEKITDVAVNSKTDDIYVLNGKKIHKFKGTNNPSIRLVNFIQDSTESDSTISYKEVDFDSRNGSVITFEYQNKNFYGLKNKLLQ